MDFGCLVLVNYSVSVFSETMNFGQQSLVGAYILHLLSVAVFSGPVYFKLAEGDRVDELASDCTVEELSGRSRGVLGQLPLTPKQVSVAHFTVTA
ncbi:hypothetical protein LINGRAHAP2_LOCUS33621 [Linum grandiflorum]